MPSSLGYVLERHPSQAASSLSSSAPIVIHIQEVHTNYSSQKKLVGILQELVSRYGVKLILVEGGEGDVGLSYLRAYGPPENRRDVAEKYLKTGILSAEEYLDIVSDAPLVLWGVERKELYKQNVKSYLDTQSLRDALAPTLVSIHESAHALKPILFSPSLIALDEQSAAFADGTLSLAEYVDALAPLFPSAGLSSEQIKHTYPNLLRFISARTIERQLDLTQVQQDQRALLQRLSETLDPKQMEEINANGRLMKEGTLKREQFYDRLAQLTESAHLSLETWPSLSRYITYVTLSAAIAPLSLSSELDAMVNALKSGLATTPESRQLQSILQELDLTEKLFQFRLSPEEHQRLRSINLEGLIRRWPRFLTPQLIQHRLPVPSWRSLIDLREVVPVLERFYELASQRDEVMVERAMEKLRETRESIAVLITGGFHSPAITQMLKQRGVSLVVIAPQVTDATDESLYRAVLRYKSGQGTFHDVNTIAEETIRIEPPAQPTGIAPARPRMTRVPTGKQGEASKP